MKIRLLITLIILVLSTPSLAWGEDIACNLSTREVEVGLDPSGDYISVSGVAPENSPVIIKVEGSVVSQQVSFGQNDSWLIKYAEFEVNGLPGYYQILTSDPTETIEKSHRTALGLSPNYDELSSKAWVRARQVHQDEPTLKLESDYIKLAIQQKVSKNLYAIRQGVVKKEGTQFYATIPLVSNMPLGELKVTAMTVRGNVIYKSEPQLVKIKSSSPLSFGFQELSINPILVIALFMVPILLMTTGQILEILEDRKRLRQLRNIWK